MFALFVPTLISSNICTFSSLVNLLVREVFVMMILLSEISGSFRDNPS